MDVAVITNLISQKLEHVTCLECCKLYVGPKTAVCGHSLCHYCWTGRRTCPTCALPIDRNLLQCNKPLEVQTTYVSELRTAFEDLFKVNFDEFQLQLHMKNEMRRNSSNVKDWLDNSQNRFSVNSQPSQICHSQVESPMCKVVVHENIGTQKATVTSPSLIVRSSVQQDDWDKIEILPDSEEFNIKNKENVVGPVDTEPFLIDDENTGRNLRRSSRNKDAKNSSTYSSIENKMSNAEADKKSLKIKQNWTNVKKMKKEFSKLNKLNKSKLNVSIEECKKNQNSAKKTIVKLKEPQPNVIDIDDNTPDILSHKNENLVVDKLHPKYGDGVVISKHQNNLATNNIDNGNVTKSAICEKQDDEKHKLEDKSKQIQSNYRNITINNREVYVPFLRKSALCPKHMNIHDNVHDSHYVGSNSPNISYINIMKNPNSVITIEIGKAITDHIKVDGRLKVKTDCQIQTSLGNYPLCDSIHKAQNENKQNESIRKENKTSESDISTSTKKHTADADTETVQGEITKTESSQKISARNNTAPNENSQNKNQQVTNLKTATEMMGSSAKDVGIENDIDIENDIFGSDPFKDPVVQLLKTTKDVTSEILPTMYKKQGNSNTKLSDKRNREITDEDEMPITKKVKIISDNILVSSSKQSVNLSLDKPCKDDAIESSFDSVMNKVFANIDAEIEETRKSQKEKKSQNAKECINQIHSENIFTGIDKSSNIYKEPDNDTQPKDLPEIMFKADSSVNVPISICPSEKEHQTMDIELGTPIQDHYDSDRSVVEDTPQKNSTISNVKLKTEINRTISSNDKQLSKFSDGKQSDLQQKPSPEGIEVINLSDVSQSINLSRPLTNIHKMTKPETPVDISKFVDQIKHKSTPVARKYLDFNNKNNTDDPEETICPTTSQIVKTTQEREFMMEAFEETPKTPVLQKTVKKIIQNKKYQVASSCLTANQMQKLMLLCSRHKWTFVEKYTRELSHLVVGVDEENKAKRSVKYMCALSAGKWIVSFDWIEKCLQTNKICEEQPFEVLDPTGEPGPKMSRTAQKKLFCDTTFYCMPPFSVLDKQSLELMLEQAGGRVVTEPTAVRAISKTPAMLLAEPEHTQEDKFIYLAMELGVVPVNYEWAINCLGTYTLQSIHGYLLCPSSLVQQAMAGWPSDLTAEEDSSI